MSDPFDDIEKMQELVAQKLAEIGITVQIPISFAKIPGGPPIVQLQGIWEDTKPVEAAVEVQDEFMQIMLADKEAEKEQREAERKAAEAQALADLKKLAGEFDDDD
jgi:hypothetical protein